MPLFIAKNGQTFGPHEPAEIEAFLMAGDFLPEDFCWQEGWSEWRPVGSVITAKPVPPAGPSQPGSHIPADAEITGTLTLAGDCTIHGRVEGEIHSTATVTIARNARATARIRAESVVVSGSIEGELRAESLAVLESPSSMLGDIHAPRLVVEDGATFNGRSNVAPKNSADTGLTK
jgi:cytoskeletal protein CcmA (bactofilin family)